MFLSKVSPITGELTTMDLPVTPEQIEAWQEGALIQDVMPHLSKAEREFLISGVTPEEWQQVFGDEA